MLLTIGTVLVAGLVLVGGTGCQSRVAPTIQTAGDDETGIDDPGDERQDRPGLPDVDLASLDVARHDGLSRIHFDYDSYALRPDALAVLSGNAAAIKAMPDNLIQIEGHCDERGTQEYNLALGERRALAARSHLMRLGILGDRIITISYGEENPVDPGHYEAAWSQNRRCMFNTAR